MVRHVMLSKSALLIWGEKKENVELLYLKKERNDFQINKIYGFQEQSRNLFFRCSPYLFQTKDRFVIQDNGELHTIILSDTGSTSFEKQALPPNALAHEPLMFFALSGQQGNEFSTMIAAMYDGYISIFEKKK